MPNKMLLIAEDNDEDYQVFREALTEVIPEALHHRVKNGEELLTFLYSDRRPDLIVLDLRMPFMDGFETLKQIRANDLFKYIPVVVLSVRDDAAEKAALTALGIDGYFAKPAQYGDTVRFIRQFSRFGFPVAP